MPFEVTSQTGLQIARHSCVPLAIVTALYDIGVTHGAEKYRTGAKSLARDRLVYQLWWSPPSNKMLPPVSGGLVWAWVFLGSRRAHQPQGQDIFAEAFWSIPFTKMDRFCSHFLQQGITPAGPGTLTFQKFYLPGHAKKTPRRRH